MEEQILYEKYSLDRHWEKHPTIYAEQFVNFLKNMDFNGKIVDLGCGNGRDVNVFNKAGFDVLGIDICKNEIKNTKTTFPKLKFEIQNIENLNFKDNFVSAYFMINVIHYVKKLKAINEVFRTLKPKGYFFIHFNMSIKDKDGNLDYFDKEEDILKSISKFKIIEKRIFERIDEKPMKHTHKIMELILQKP